MNNKTRVAVWTTAGALSLGGIYAASIQTHPTPIHAAHSSSEAVDCHGFDLEGWVYEGPKENNKLSYNFDGIQAGFNFAEGYTRKAKWDPTKSHVLIVSVNANINTGDPNQYDFTRTYNIPACEETTTTISETTIPDDTTPATDSVPDVTTTVPPDSTVAPTLPFNFEPGPSIAPVTTVAIPPTTANHVSYPDESTTTAVVAVDLPPVPSTAVQVVSIPTPTVPSAGLPETR